jgi:Xaa-Pro aminopeptidase
MTSRPADLASGLGELGCRALLLYAPDSGDPDLGAFLRAPAHFGHSLLVAPAAGPARLCYLTDMERQEVAASGLTLLGPADLEVARLAGDFTELAPFLVRVAERALALCGVEPGRLALAGHGPAGVIQQLAAGLAEGGWRFTSGNPLVTTLRKRKEEGELAGIREAAAGTVAALRRVAELLASASTGVEGDLQLSGERLTVGRLRREVALILAGRGLEQPRGNLVAPAEEGGIPHSQGSPERVLRAGEPLVVDLFPRGRLFADCTRTFCVGSPSEPLRRAWAAVHDALGVARAGARPGVRGWSLQEEVCARFSAAGFPTPISDPATQVGYVHNLGHGVGFDLHEHPSFRKAAGAEGVLREGDVFTLEPGLYDPAQGYGVRLEDLYWLGPEGLESLTPLPYDLDPRAWG